MAGRLALRGHGCVEPNPMVGCVIARGADIVGWGRHERFGGPHAEVIALKRAGERARGATAYLTLEPCSHQGKTPPCTTALVEAGIAKVVIAQADPNPVATGGAATLREAGIEVEFDDHSAIARQASAPFIHRTRTGLPWVIAKWAQTIDGKIATRTGESQWISNECSRRMVHRERGRVDILLTGIGTVLADDPLLTAREVRVRRIARRVIVDAHLDTPLDARLVSSSHEYPTTFACLRSAVDQEPEKHRRFIDAGIEMIPLPGEDRLLLRALLSELVRRYDATNVLVEAGPRLLGGFIREKLINVAWVFIGPRLLADEHARTVAEGAVAARLGDGALLQLHSVRRRGDDVVLFYLVDP